MASIMQDIGGPGVSAFPIMPTPNGNDLYITISTGSNMPSPADLNDYLKNLEYSFRTGTIYVFLPESVAHRFLVHVISRKYAFHRHEVSPAVGGSLVYYKWCKHGFTPNVAPYATSSDRFAIILLDPSGENVLLMSETPRGLGGPTGTPHWVCPIGYVTAGDLLVSVGQFLLTDLCVAADDSAGCTYVGCTMKAKDKSGCMQDRLEILAMKAKMAPIQMAPRTRWVPLKHLVYEVPKFAQSNDGVYFHSEGFIYKAEHVGWIVRAMSGHCMRVTRTLDGTMNIS